MVTSTATKNTPLFPTRAPAQRLVGHFVAISCSVPNDSRELYNDDCRSYAQLVSPSRDPIGYAGGKFLYDSGLTIKYVDPYGFQYTDPAGKSCDPEKTCKVWICAYCDKNLHPVLQRLLNLPGTVGHVSFCWNCQDNYGAVTPTDGKMPDEDPWNKFDKRLKRRGCVGLYPGGRDDDWDYQDENCTHMSEVVEVCPATLVKADENSRAPEYDCAWELFPRTEKQANCMSWACKMYRGADLPFPPDIIDPYVFCNDDTLPVVKRIPRPDRPYK